MNTKQKRVLYRIIVSAVLFIFAILPFVNGIFSTAILLASYLVIGYDILWKAIKNTVRGKLMDENFLMSIATVSAVITGEYHESVFVMLFYQVGELFQSIAVGKSRKSIASLMQIRPDSAEVIRGGKTVTVLPDEVAVGETVAVRPGGRVPLDGIIISGGTDIDTSALTGESVPVYKTVGDSIVSGSVVMSGVIELRVTKAYSESTVSKILELTENAAVNKAKSEQFITRFAHVYTPTVVIAAALLALIPPLFAGNFTDWLYRAMTFLVISCPCALVISVPLTFFGGIGGMSKQGILVKGGGYIEALAKCRTAVFDKTGTLTYGRLTVTQVIPEGVSEAELLELAAHAESWSSHPISLAIASRYGECDRTRVTDIKEHAGMGISAVVDGKQIKVGNKRLIDGSIPEQSGDGTYVYVECDGKYIGYIVLCDTIKEDAKAAIDGLKAAGVSRAVMLTGDRAQSAQAVAAGMGIDEVYSRLMPQDKVEITKEIIYKSRPNTVMFTGDGINDAPVLAMADVGVAMGALGSDAAIEAADVVIMDDKPSKLITAVRMSRKICRIVNQNIVFVLTIKAVTLVLGALGVANMWMAVFADVGVAVIAILNSLRTQR